MYPLAYRNGLYSTKISVNKDENIVQGITTKLEHGISWGSGNAGFESSCHKIISRWVQLGKDPVVDAPIYATKCEMNSRHRALREDMLGTDLMSTDEAHRAQSRTFWKKIIKDRILGEMSNRSAEGSDLGRLTFNSNEQSVRAAEGHNEAARWEDDLNFAKCVNTCKDIFGSSPRNMRDFEILLESASADELYAFWNGAKTQLETQPNAVLGLAAVTFYEGADLKDYCQRIKPLNDSRRDFAKVFCTDVNRCGGWAIVAGRLASLYAQVFEVHKERRTRQVDSGIRKAWNVMTESEQISSCLSERDLMERRIIEGVFDPETNDSTQAWQNENNRIQEILGTKVTGCSFTFGRFWKHYERVVEMQREHMFVSYAAKLKFARCFQRVRNELGGNEDALYASYVESMKCSTFDFGNGIIIPYMSDIWCKINWPFFGSSGCTQNTPNGRRVHMFHHGTPSQVKAIARAFYNTRPLSESIDYSSPYTYRQSHADIYADAGVDMLKDRGQSCHSTDALCAWEEDLARVVNAARSRMGKVRRRYIENARIAFAQTPESGGPIGDVKVCLHKSTTKLNEWVVGQKNTISFTWMPNELAKAEGTESLESNYKRCSAGRIEISLWLRKTKNCLENENRSLQQVRSLCNKAMMHDISHYTLWFYQNVVHNSRCLDARSKFIFDRDMSVSSTEPFVDIVDVLDDSEHSEWNFVSMLADNIELTGDTSHHVLLPYAMRTLGGGYSPLVAGEYRVRVRCFRHVMSPSRDSAQCVQQYSEPFVVVDRLKEDVQKSVGNFATSADKISAENLPHVVQNLRQMGYEISIDTEYVLGQCITPRKDIYIDFIAQVLRSGKGSKSACEVGLSDDELWAEKAIFQRFAELNPGATLDEWMSVRRSKLAQAFTGLESAWWIEDDLETDEITMRNLNEPIWYAHDKISSLSAEGTFHESHGCCLARAEVDGTGLISQLSIIDHRDHPTLNQAVTAIHGSMHHAHTRLSFLAHGKLAPLIENVNWSIAEREHGYNGFASWGGKYLRTIHYCFQCAQRNLRHKMNNVESMIRYKAVERWGSPEYKFRTEKPTQEYRLGPHEAIVESDHSWPR